jgi:Short C-terminal domain
MKNLIIILLLIATAPCFGQKKKKVDPKDQQIDTLTKANSALSTQLDSVSKISNGLYTALKEKVLLKDFDPTKLPEIIDSIRASRDSTNLLQSAPLKDSLSMMSKRNNLLQTQLDSMTVAANQKKVPDPADKAKLMTELKDLKALLDAKIITQAEFDTKKKLIMDKWE